MRGRPGSICFVVADQCGLNNPDGPAVREYLRRSWTGHVLNCGSTPLAGGFTTRGVRVHRLDPAPLPAAFRVRNLYEPSHADRADVVRLVLERLHRAYQFDVILFGTHGGLGFRAIQAKRAGLAFHGVTLAVRFDTTSQQEREREHRWPANLEEVVVDYMEKTAFESADKQIIPDVDSAGSLRRLGWVVRPERLRSEDVPFVAESVTAAVPGPDTPPVTVGIAHFNLGGVLPAALESLAAQTYPNVEVVVIDDGSTDPHSAAVVREMEARYPRFRFLHQSNAGIGAARNRCLAEARGEFFISMDADNLARPDMVERFVAAIRRNPDLSAMTCYFLAFGGDTADAPDDFLYACRPTGGPHAMSSIRNVYGDANAIFRTAEFRAVGGYEADRGTSCEDWEVFVKLVHAGKRIGVVPDHLFYYRHRAGGFSRVTNWFANHQRVLRQFASQDRLPPGEAAVLWAALLGFQQHAAHLADRQRCRRYRIADALHAGVSAPYRGLKRLAARLTRRS